jgi:sulfite reductase (ferredoxin)
VIRVVRRFAGERTAGETFRSWMDRSGGAKTVAEGLKDLDFFPTPAEAPEMFVDWDETTPFGVTLGASECA